MNSLMRLLLSLSLSGALVAGVIFLLRPLLGKRVSRSWRYYIWLVVFARLLLPLTPAESPVGRLFEPQAKPVSVQHTPADTPVYTAPERPEADAARYGEPAGLVEAVPPQAPRDTAPKPLPGSWLWLVWGAVALALLIRKLTAYQSFVQYARAGCAYVSDPEVLNRYSEVCERAGVKRPPELCVNPLIASPMLVGVLKPFIVLPGVREDGGLEEILLHELLHYKRLDLYYKWLVQLTLCLHWFNPVVWLAAREMGRDCELSCDEAVLARLDTAAHRSYGDTLLASLRMEGYRASVVPLTLTEDARQLKERLVSIMNYQKQSRGRSALSAALAAALCVGAISVGAYAANRGATSDSAFSNLLSSSSEQEKVKADAGTAEGTLELAMKALKDLDMETFNSYSDNKRAENTFIKKNFQRDYMLFGNLAPEKKISSKRLAEEQRFAGAIVEKLSWKIGAVTVNGDSAVMKMAVSNRDMSDVSGLFEADILEDVAKDMADNGADMDIDRDLVDYIKAARGSITLQLTVSAERKGGKWIIHVDDAFANAVFGNMNDGGEHPSKAVQARIDAANEAVNKATERITQEAMRDAEEAMRDANEALRETEENLRDLNLDQLDEEMDRMRDEWQDALEDYQSELSDLGLAGEITKGIIKGTMDEVGNAIGNSIPNAFKGALWG